MKAAISSLLLLFAFGPACFAGDNPRTIVTRDHEVYEKASIVDHDKAFATISYDAGVVRVAMENLPADIQMELGYISRIPAPPKVAKSTPASPRPVLAPAIGGQASAQPRPAPAVAEYSPTPTPVLEKLAPAPAKVFSQATVNAFYGLKEAAIVKKMGKPLKIEKFTDFNQRKVKVLIYDEDEATGTKFFIYEKEGFVSGGCCDGKAIRSPAQEAILDKEKSAGN